MVPSFEIPWTDLVGTIGNGTSTWIVSGFDAMRLLVEFVVGLVAAFMTDFRLKMLVKPVPLAFLVSGALALLTSSLLFFPADKLSPNTLAAPNKDDPTKPEFAVAAKSSQFLASC